MESFFGEIREPTTRALIDDDDEYPEYQREEPQITGTFQVPSIIASLIFAETHNIKNVLCAGVIGKAKPTCEVTNAGIEVYSIKGNNYVIFWNGTKTFSIAEIADLFQPWLGSAEKIYTVTSGSIGLYQNNNSKVKPPSLVRFLSNDEGESYFCGKLEAPNLITGLSAGILSFSTHLGLKCTSFITYLDNMPLDSVNIGPLVTVLNAIQVPFIGNPFKSIASFNNLYM